MKNLQEFKFKELSTNEQKTISGGNVWKAIVTALVISAIDNWGDIRDGWNDGAKGKPRYH